MTPSSGHPRNRREERGAVAVVVALLFASIMLGLAAVGVDTARWYLARERVQRAADAAALAGVVYLPDNLSQAVVTARQSARLNGYAHNPPETVVDVTYGERRSQLRVTIETTVPNQFGPAIGVDSAQISRTSVADYTTPAPMGSPCNVFGSEPAGGNNDLAQDPPTKRGASGPQGSQIPLAYRTSGICKTNPNYWAVVEGPSTDKQNGDRYGTVPCTLTPAPFGCASKKNAEGIFPEGYFFAIKVPQTAVGTPINLQLYDPAFFNTGAGCSTNMPATQSTTKDALNDFVTDAKLRYTSPKRFSSTADQEKARQFCSGDFLPVRPSPAPTTLRYPVTSFSVRAANDAQDPMQGAPYAGCTAQFPGFGQPPTLEELTGTHRDYKDYMARLWHQWVPLCTFTPTRAGNHYLQVRTNVAIGGTEQFDSTASPARPTRIFRDNAAVNQRAGNSTVGEGVNAFSIRAISAKADQIAVSGWARMPMFQNVPSSTATFNLIRVPLAAAGQSIAFEFYDVADGSDDVGTVQVIPPRTASDVQPAPYTNCKAALNGGDPGPDLTACTVRVANSSHNGQVQRMSIPIPSTYTCKEADLTGCWFTVKITMNGDLTDVTTWDASLDGDPVRLIE